MATIDFDYLEKLTVLKLCFYLGFILKNVFQKNGIQKLI